MTPLVESIGGWLDGAIEHGVVYTVPVVAGFGQIESIADAVVGRYPGAEWIYGNIYSVDDGTTPLNWW